MWHNKSLRFTIKLNDKQPVTLIIIFITPIYNLPVCLVKNGIKKY
jgi:hypothetical protein